MADHFYRFSSDVTALGAGKIDKMELLTDDVEEEEYDALNDETFGADITGECDDWEEDHEKFAELEDKASSSKTVGMFRDYDNYQTPDKHTQERNNVEYQRGISEYLGMRGQDEEKDIAESISQLVLDDDMDDPAIMNISRSRILMKNDGRLRYAVSPPPPAIVETDTVGSPSTNSIWSTNHTSPHSGPSKSNTPIVTVFSYIKRNKPAFHDVQFEDPSIISATKIPLSAASQEVGPKLIPNVKTLEELEKDLLLASCKNTSPILPKAQMIDDVERDILLKPRARTVSEIEHDISSAQSIAQKTLRPGLQSPKFVNGQSRSSLPLLGDRNGYCATSFPQNVASLPMSIPGRNFGSTPPKSGLASSPPVLTSAAMPSPPRQLLSSPPFQNIGSPLTKAGALRNQQYMTRLIPPQLTSVQRHPYLSGQPLLVGRMGYPGVQPNSSLSAGIFAYPHPHFPMNFADPRNMRRFPPPSMNNQIRPKFSPHKRNSWSENSNNLRHHFTSHHRDSNCEIDEYANLMSQKEKDWLIKIQMMQLLTDNPYLDDYYYTTFMLNKRIKASKESLKSQEPTLVIPERSKTESRVYQPAHFEGSLGKLQVLSVNCPRRMIDLDGVHQEENEAELQKVRNRELRKFRQLLLEIEKIYALFLEIDDLDKKAAALPEEARVQLYDNKNAIILKVYNGLIQNGKEHLVQIMLIRKGRKLVCRALPLFSLKQALNILSVIVNSFPVILKKDLHDQILPSLLEWISVIISAAPYSQVVDLGLKLWNIGDSEPPQHKSQHLVILQNEVGASIVSKLITRADELYQAECNTDASLHHKWCLFILHVSEVLLNLPDEFTVPTFCPQLSSQLIDHCRRFSIECPKVDALKEKFKHTDNLEMAITDLMFT